MLNDVMRTLFITIILVLVSLPQIAATNSGSGQGELFSSYRELKSRLWMSTGPSLTPDDLDSKIESFLEVLVGYVRKGLLITNPAGVKSAEEFFTPANLSGHCILAQGLVSIYLEDLGVSSDNYVLLEMGKDFGSKQVHALVIVKMHNGHFYMIDPTFAQFFESGSLAGDIGQRMIQSSSSSLAIDLCKKGFSKLTDKRLKDYLGSFPVNSIKVAGITLNKLEESPRTTSPLNRSLYGKNLPRVKTLKQLRFEVMNQ